MTVGRIRSSPVFQRLRLLRLFERRTPYSLISPEAWKGRLVFDVAPDVGQTPKLFLKLGAGRVVAYADKKSQFQDARVEWNGKFYIYDMLFKYSDDDINNSVLVMDCDGYEHVIRPSNLVSIFPSWAVTIHTSSLEYRGWYETLEKRGRLISSRRRENVFTNLPLRGERARK